jgi:hypothetical protein
MDGRQILGNSFQKVAGAEVVNSKYRRNHYVPQWYQNRFFIDQAGERKFHYLDLKPETFRDPKGILRTKKACRRWGTPSCFELTDLYTMKFGAWESTDIEEKFFGKIDGDGRNAVERYATFRHQDADPASFQALMRYMSVQKLRTPKGLSYLTSVTNSRDRNEVLLRMQEFSDLHAAIWTESIWSVADAGRSATKFIISDHPVTVYNADCFPGSDWCRDFRDPDIWLQGTHTLFPLSADKILIITNLGWVRNPYGKGTAVRPNPNPLRSAMFDLRAIQIGRELTEDEVRRINYIIKRRAYRYIAAAREEWLYPEKAVSSEHWRKVGGGHLLMPDPRSVVFSGVIAVGYRGGGSEAYDEYGRRPWQGEFEDEAQRKKEWNTFLRFQGEFARSFGPKRRGQSFKLNSLDNAEDEPWYHESHLDLDRRRRPQGRRRTERS